MKVARADAKDLDAGMMLLGLLDTVSSGYYPSDTDDEDDGPLRFDSEDPTHLAQLWKRLNACFDAAPGFQGRVIFGAATLMDPRNKVIDPEADCLELHPALKAAQQDAERLEWLMRNVSAAEWERLGVTHDGGKDGRTRIDAAMAMPANAGANSAGACAGPATEGSES